MRDFKILGTDHTGATISDNGRMSGFFRDVPRCDTAEAVEHGGYMVERFTGVPGAENKSAFVDLPGHKIESIAYFKLADEKTPDLGDRDPDAFDLTMEVDDIAVAASAARERGFTAFGAPQTVPEDPRKGNRNVCLKNPDGIVVVFQASVAQD